MVLVVSVAGAFVGALLPAGIVFAGLPAAPFFTTAFRAAFGAAFAAGFAFGALVAAGFDVTLFFGAAFFVVFAAGLLAGPLETGVFTALAFFAVALFAAAFPAAGLAAVALDFAGFELEAARVEEGPLARAAAGLAAVVPGRDGFVARVLPFTVWADDLAAVRLAVLLFAVFFVAILVPCSALQLFQPCRQPIFRHAPAV